MFDSSSQIAFLVVGCDHYQELKQLHNVRNDLNRYKQIFCNSEYSLYDEKDFVELYDETSNDLRLAIKEFVFSRAAEQNTLVLIFCGHGTAIGSDDFGFCMTDAVKHPEDGVIMPTSVVKLSEIVGSLNIKNISLILIVDACYSGQIGKKAFVPFTKITLEMSKSLVAYSGNFFGFISSCSNIEQIVDVGVISKGIEDICEQGISENEPDIKIGFLAESLPERIDSYAKGDSRSRVFIPPGKISKIGLCKNLQYIEPKEPVNIYSFTKPYLKLLDVLWNNGTPISLTPKEILKRTGSQSAYANHNKLSLQCWELLETGERGTRRLSQKGRNFIQGKLSIPKVIVEYKETRQCTAHDMSPNIKVAFQKDIFGNLVKELREIVS